MNHAKLRRIAQQRGLGSLSNDTKWRELIERIDAMAYCPRYRYKCIDSEEHNTNVGDWYALPQPFMSIELLDVSCLEELCNGQLLAKKIVDHSAAIESILQSIGLAYTRGESCIRIFGYAPHCETGMETF